MTSGIGKEFKCDFMKMWFIFRSIKRIVCVSSSDQRFVVRKSPALLQEMINVGCQLTMMANSRGGTPSYSYSPQSGLYFLCFFPLVMISEHSFNLLQVSTLPGWWPLRIVWNWPRWSCRACRSPSHRCCSCLILKRSTSATAFLRR